MSNYALISFKYNIKTNRFRLMSILSQFTEFYQQFSLSTHRTKCFPIVSILYSMGWREKYKWLFHFHRMHDQWTENKIYFQIKTNNINIV